MSKSLKLTEFNTFMYVYRQYLIDKSVSIKVVIFVFYSSLEKLEKPFAISTEYVQRMLERCDTFREVTETNKSLQLTMVTSAGLVHNAGWQSINNEVDIDDLFHE